MVWLLCQRNTKIYMAHDDHIINLCVLYMFIFIVWQCVSIIVEYMIVVIGMT